MKIKSNLNQAKSIILLWYFIWYCISMVRLQRYQSLEIICTTFFYIKTKLHATKHPYFKNSHKGQLAKLHLSPRALFLPTSPCIWRKCTFIELILPVLLATFPSICAYFLFFHRFVRIPTFCNTTEEQQCFIPKREHWQPVFYTAWELNESSAIQTELLYV